VKLDIKYMVQGRKYFPHVFRSSQTQGDHFPRYPNLNTMIPVTYVPMEGVLLVVAGPHPTDRYTWEDD
jgi:hypothetical protein